MAQWDSIFQEIKEKGDESGDPEGELVMVYPPPKHKKMKLEDARFMDGVTTLEEVSGKEVRRVYSNLNPQERIAKKKTIMMDLHEKGFFGCVNFKIKDG